MKAEFQIHNLFKKDLNLYINYDPHLSSLKDLKYVFRSSLEREIPVHIPGIYILTGGRQVGKSTLVKLIIENLLIKQKEPARRIFYIPCDILQRYQDLIFIIQQAFDEIGREKYFYMFLDEITYVKEWDRAIKYFADMGYFKRGFILITGSDSIILKDSMKYFPGRRGKSGKTDFHYHPLSFSEYLLLTMPELKNEVQTVRELYSSIEDIETELNSKKIRVIDECFQNYLLSGGFLPAINEYESSKKIGSSVYQTYSQWVVGDILKRNKKEHFLKDIILTLTERLAKQVTLHNIASMTEIQHHSTVQDYLSILEDMDVVFIQYTLREDKLQPSPRKAKKIHFSDPFIAQSLISWSRDIAVPWEYFKNNFISESPLKGDIIEGCISSLLRRKFRIYYIKSEGEVDIAILSEKGFLPVEIKWSEKLRRNDLKQILKYKKGIIGYKGIHIGKYEQLYVLPIPIIALFV